MNSKIKAYIDEVRSGDYEFCEEQYKLVDLVEKVFTEENVYVDDVQLEKYLSYQKYFDFELFPWEIFVFALHNCTYSAPGILRFPDLLLLCGRGTGKNGYFAFEDFCLLTPVNGIKNYDIDICATNEDQARRSFDDVYDVLKSNKAKMSKHFTWNKTIIRNIKTNSALRFRTSNAETKDGGRPGKIDFDEYHAYENYKLINVFKTGFGKRPMPRSTIATTMGYIRDGPLDNLLEHALDILDGKTPDNGLLPFICRLDDEEEADNEKNWHKANPSLRFFPVLLQEMRKEYIDYKRDPIGNSDFMTKRMNRPKIGGNEVPVTDWDNILATNKEIPDLTGRACVFGVDYMMTTDFLAVGLLFIVDGKKYWITHSWYCENSIDLPRIRFPIDGEAARGTLTRISGVEIPPEVVSDWIYENQKKYNIIAGALDNYRYTLLKKPLEAIGYSADKGKESNLILVRPSDRAKILPVITSDFANRRIIWGDNRIMRWYTNNTKIIESRGGNKDFGKIEPKSRKTDGFYAFVHANVIADKLNVFSTRSGSPLDYMEVYTY